MPLRPVPSRLRLKQEVIRPAFRKVRTRSPLVCVLNPFAISIMTHHSYNSKQLLQQCVAQADRLEQLLPSEHGAL